MQPSSLASQMEHDQEMKVARPDDSHTSAGRELIEALESRDIEAQAGAMRRLGIGNSSDLPLFLTDRLGDVSREVRTSALRAFAALGEDAIFNLIDCLADPDHVMRRYAAWVIRELDDSRPLVRHIKEVLGDDEGSRRASIRALIELGDHRTVPCLIYALDAGEVSGRADAAAALGELGDERAVAPLIGMADRGPAEKLIVWELYTKVNRTLVDESPVRRKFQIILFARVL